MGAGLAALSQRQNASHAELAEACSFPTNSGLIKLFHHFQSLAQSKSQKLQSLFWTAQLPPPVLWLPSQAFLGLSKSVRGVRLNQSVLKQLKDTIHAQHLAFCNLIRVREVTVWATEIIRTGPMSNMITVFVQRSQYDMKYQDTDQQNGCSLRRLSRLVPPPHCETSLLENDQNSGPLSPCLIMPVA